jgi:hypothetical protein
LFESLGWAKQERWSKVLEPVTPKVPDYQVPGVTKEPIHLKTDKDTDRIREKILSLSHLISLFGGLL